MSIFRKQFDRPWTQSLNTQCRNPYPRSVNASNRPLCVLNNHRGATRLTVTRYHVEAQLQSENRILGLQAYLGKGQEAPDLSNAGGKETVTLLPGVACFGSDQGFGTISSGKNNLMVLRAMESSGKEGLAKYEFTRLGMAALKWTRFLRFGDNHGRDVARRSKKASEGPWISSLIPLPPKAL